jgi:hypothetical protein
MASTRQKTPPPKRKQTRKKPSLVKEYTGPGGKRDWRGYEHGLFGPIGAARAKHKYPGGHIGQAVRGVKSYLRKRKAQKAHDASLTPGERKRLRK